MAMASTKSKKSAVKQAMKFGVCGPIPLTECYLSKQESKQHKNHRRSEEQFDEALSFLKFSFDEGNECVQIFFCLYEVWVEERENCIKEIKRIAKQRDTHQRNINIAKLHTAGAGIASSALCVSGLALAPVTLGTSLPLTISGTCIGIATAAADAGIAASTVAANAHASLRAKKCFQEHLDTTQKMQDILNQLLGHHKDAIQLVKEDIMGHAGLIPAWNIHGATNGAASCATNTGKIMFSIFYTLIKDCKSLHFLRKGFALVNEVATGFKMFTRVAGFAFSALGILVDLIKMVVTGFDLYKGSETSLGKELGSIADELERELEDVTRILQALSGDVEVLSDDEILALCMSG